MTVKELAQKMADTYRANPTSWTQQYNARTANGSITEVESDRAVSWCIYGLAAKITGCTRERLGLNYYELTSAIAEQIPDDHMMSVWNDAEERTVNDVIELLEKVAK